MSQSNVISIDDALALIRAGSPLAIPTETVYGLAASIDNPLAIRQIFALKERPVNHPLIIHVSSVEMAMNYAHFTPLATTLANEFWPGPLTLILTKKDSVPNEVTGGLNTVGLRSPLHSQTLKLIKAHGCPLAAPSANKFGRISPTCASHVRDDFNDLVPVLDGGDCQIGLESTILDCSTDLPSIRRLGAVTTEHLKKFIEEFGHSETVTPGTLKAHYAPLTSLLLSDKANEEASTLRQKGLSVAVLIYDDSNHFAQKLYAELRRLDKLGVDVLVVQRPTSKGLGEAILDRLNRASVGSPFQRD